jgi:hypothetical protein
MKWGFFALFLTMAFLLAVVSSINTVTLFHGSHLISNISASGNDIECTGCHQWVQEELSDSAIHSDLSCTDCHRFTETGITFAAHDGGIQVGEEAHAAYTPRCLDCHGGSGIWIVNKAGSPVYAPPAKAFNESDYGADYSAHKKFVKQSLNCSLSEGENEACIACHTNYSVVIDYSYFWNINYDLDNWNVPFTSFSYNGTREYDITFSKTGAKHEFVNVNDINCISCHENIYDALVNGTDDTPDDYLTHAPIEISHKSDGMGKEWDTDNPWNNYRYHYIPSANRATWVNSSYCYECHNVKRYADNNPSDSTTYDLGDVTSDTNSTQIHAAEALWCQTCHGIGKTKAVINNPDQMGSGHSGTNFVDDVANSYARTFDGDICMGCHEAAVHPTQNCGRCHHMGNADVTIESEPSGYATNTG